MGSWYTTLDALKRAAGIAGPQLDAVIADEIDSASREVEALLHRRFIPITATHMYRWPQTVPGRTGAVLYLDDDLLAVTALTRDDDTATAISASDYFLEPQTLGPPYDKIEIDLSSVAYFGNLSTPQRAVRVTGSWGYPVTYATAGALAGSLTDSATALNVTDAGKVSVGATLLCGSEQLFVTAAGLLTTTATLSAGIAANAAVVTLPVSDGSKVKTGELIQVDAEKMLVYAVAGNNAFAYRAQDATPLAAHDSGATVYAYRALTVERGVNGTTAASHSDAAALSQIVPNPTVSRYVRAVATNAVFQGKAGWSGTVGAGEAQIELRMNVIRDLRKELVYHYRRTSAGAVGGAR